MTEYSEDPFQMDEDFEVVENEEPLTNDITPNYELNDTTRFDIKKDNELIRSKIAQLKLQENNTANNTTEEDEIYEEDIDDKFDPELQKKLQNDFELTKDDSNPELTPPENFAPVINTIYRSSFPQPINFTFLKKLKLKSILCLIPEEYPEIHTNFLKDEGVKLFQLGMSGNKEPFVKISSELITEAIKIVINPENQPILIHCNRGKHRTGCLVGVLRRLQKWSLTIIFDEYRKFSAPKERPMDQQFIELYDEKEIVKFAQDNNFLPLKWD
ncbi:inositol phosphatase Siw14p [[Candida] anglica]|uniref:diphosphoinositol-polyphosphate diphosphatase n=1 Tax=[Candida] anglica TaxID=148631 RepID=A0ABP0E8K3_9ASCO